MPISSGALDWPVSYYTKPTAVEDVANGYDNLDPWSRSYAYRNWTWKRKRNTRKKKREKDSPEDRRRHRRRCCCCALWWLTALLLIILTLVLFLVFWIRDRGNNIPDLNPDVYDNIPHCKGTWRKTFILAQFNKTQNKTYVCCYGVDKKTLADLLQYGDTWPAAWVLDKSPCPGFKTCGAAFPNDPVCSASDLQLSPCLLFGLAWVVYNYMTDYDFHG